MMLTDNAQLSGIALALLGLAGAVHKRWWSGWCLGTGTGIAFLAKGLLGPGLMAITCALLLCFPAWRNRTGESPHLFAEWFSQNNVGRFLGYAPEYLNAVKDSRFWYTTLWWSSFPILPLSVLSLRLYRKDWQLLPAIQIGLAFTAALLGTLLLSSTLRAIYALPLLLALSLIAAPILRNPPEWLNRYGSSGSRWIFLLLGLTLWIAWSGPILQWVPQGLHQDLNLNDPLLSVNYFAVITALLITAGWLIGQWCWRNQPWRVGATWYGGLFNIFALVTLLWLPLLDRKYGYRMLFERMNTALPNEGCISSIGLGD